MLSDDEVLNYIKGDAFLANTLDELYWDTEIDDRIDYARQFIGVIKRVRADEREACAKLIEQRGQRYVSKWMNYDDMETQSKAYAWEANQHAAAIRARKENK